MKNSYLENSTVQLCQLDDRKKPKSVASGCLLNYKEKCFLLTVEHTTRNKGDWAIELEYDKVRGTKCHQMGAMNFVMQFTLPDTSGEVIDFSYVEIPDDLDVYRHYLTQEGDTIKKVIINKYSCDLKTSPNKQESYGFSGNIMSGIDNSRFPYRPYLKRCFVYYEDLKFIKEYENFLVFKLPSVHPGHEYFKGCSGAPVISSNNELLGLVCHGDIDSNEIYAISLPKMSVILDAHIMAEEHKLQ